MCNIVESLKPSYFTLSIFIKPFNNISRVIFYIRPGSAQLCSNMLSDAGLQAAPEFVSESGVNSFSARLIVMLDCHSPGVAHRPSEFHAQKKA